MAKVVIKVSMNDNKSRTRAMKIAVSANGVVSAELHGDSRNQIVVTGEGIDSTSLTMSIRKKVGFTELVSVTVIEEKKKEEKKDEKKDKAKPMIWTPYQYNTYVYTPQYNTPHVYMAEAQNNYHDHDQCSIMLRNRD